jgi:formamidopyrimidine-DNA glycosylase
MPEAPEVASILSTLKQNVQDEEIERAEISYEKLVDNMPMSEFCQNLAHQHFRNFYRKGKYLIIALDDYDLIAHMRMEGRFLLCEKLPENLKHIHAIFSLKNGQYLCYQDTRKFGRMQLYEKREDVFSLPPVSKLGLDVLDEGLDGPYLYTHLHKKKIPIKNALLDQSIAAGIGNIYANEILFAAKIHPQTACSDLSLQDCEQLAMQTHLIIEKAMAAKGTTIRTFSYDGTHTGGFQNQLKVHGKNGKACTVCGTPIEKIVISQRSAYLCPNCQKKKS